MELHEIVAKLESTSGKNDKLAILKENKNNDDLREFLYLALEPTVLFYIKSLPTFTPDSRPLDRRSFSDATYDLVNKVASRHFTGNDARNLVVNLLESLPAEDAELLRRVVLKDASIGVSEKTVNKVWPGLCTEKLYMRCASFNEDNLNKVKYPALVQLKADGLFMNIIIKKTLGTVTFLSRNMKAMSFHGHLENELLSMDLAGDTVIHGEGLVIKKDGSGYEDRKTGNGIISKAIKGTITEEDASRVHLKVWDILPLDAWKKKVCDFPYEIRIKTLEKKLPATDKIKIIKTKLIHSLEEAYEFFNAELAKGNEGAILKNLHGIWKNHTSPNQVKMKKKDPADLLCVGTLPFAKKTVTRGSEEVDSSNWIGSLILQSSDGIIKVNAGSGLNDKMRERPADYFINHIWEVEYNEVIGNKKDDQLSLFLPIIKERRDDKDEADSYELILERAKGAKGKK